MYKSVCRKYAKLYTRKHINMPSHRIHRHIRISLRKPMHLREFDRWSSLQHPSSCMMSEETWAIQPRPHSEPVSQQLDAMVAPIKLQEAIVHNRTRLQSNQHTPANVSTERPAWDIQRASPLWNPILHGVLRCLLCCPICKLRASALSAFTLRHGRRDPTP